MPESQPFEEVHPGLLYSGPGRRVQSRSRRRSRQSLAVFPGNASHIQDIPGLGLHVWEPSTRPQEGKQG